MCREARPRLVELDRLEAHLVARRALAEQTVVDGGHDRGHRVSAERGVVGTEHDRLAAGRDLHGAGHHALGVELDRRASSPGPPGHRRRRSSRGAARPGCSSHPRGNAGRAKRANTSGTKRSPCGPATTRSDQRRVARDRRGAGPAPGGPERRLPGSGGKDLPRPERARAQAAQLVAGQAGEQLGSDAGRRPRPDKCAARRAGARSRAAGPGPAAPPGRPAPPRRRPGHRARLRPPRRDRQTRQRIRVPPRGDLQRARSVAVAHQPVGQQEGVGVGRPAAGTPMAATPRRPSSCEHGAQPGRHDLEHRSGPRRPPARRALPPARARPAAPGPATVKRTTSPDASAA